MPLAGEVVNRLLGPIPLVPATACSSLYVQKSSIPVFTENPRRVLLGNPVSGKYHSRKLRIRGHKKPDLLREPRHLTPSLLACLVRHYLSGCDVSGEDILWTL